VYYDYSKLRSKMSDCIIIILDGVGVGELPDADKYGDIGSDTLGNTAKKMGGLNLPNLQKLGLGNLHDVEGVPPINSPIASYGKMSELSKGKDSTTGHWELMGVVTEVPFPTYPDGFPEEIISQFTKLTGYEVIGNKPASGTVIIEELGDQHLESGKLIVYTSADSVFQIAAHTDLIPLEELYRVCEITREFLKPPHKMSRVIARPFNGKSGEYARTVDRKDYSVIPPDSLIMKQLENAGVEVVAIGKVSDLYAGLGVTRKLVSKSNAQGMNVLDELYSQKTDTDRLILLNLVDFDMLWGHRNNPQGMAKDLELFDEWLGGFLGTLCNEDLLLLTADHGNDPTSDSSDHSREFVPVIAMIKNNLIGTDLGTRATFADFGKTVADYFSVLGKFPGTSFLEQIRGK
jgi:phosphopentomutase